MSDNTEITRLQQQLIDLQTQLAFQEDALQALNTVITRQQTSIDQLQQEGREYRALLDSLYSRVDYGGEEIPPPHY